MARRNWIMIAVVPLFLLACGDGPPGKNENNQNADTNNATPGDTNSGSNGETAGTNGETAGTNGDTSGTNNPTNNGTSGTNNETNNETNNGTSGTNNETNNMTTPPNDPPVAVDDMAVTNQEPVTIDVLANDSDPDGDALQIVSVSAGIGGTPTIAGGMVEFTPNQGYAGTDTFTYTVSDGRGGEATANVQVLVNAPPLAVADDALTNVDTPVTIDVLANDSDPEGQMLVVTAVTPPPNGTATTDGAIVTYTPGAGFSGQDAFDYEITDEYGSTAMATVTVEVNAPPVAVDDTAMTDAVTPVVVDVLANDSDPEGDALSVAMVTDPANGFATTNGALVRYTPVGTFTGTDSFTYVVEDDRGGSAMATVQVDVAPTPDGLPLAAGGSHTCAIDDAGALSCWGRGTQGQLGSAPSEDKPAPAVVGSATDWNGVTGGGDHSCGTRDDGTLWCWGSGTDGELGIGAFTSSDFPVQVGSDTDWESASAGDRFSCAIRAGALYCFGWNLDGQIGIGSGSTRVEMPSRVTQGADDWTLVSAGHDHACGLKGTGELWCWGDNGSDQLGDPNARFDVDAPIQISMSDDWRTVAAGGNHTCGIREGRLYCWGAGYYGATGTGGSQNVETPTQIGSQTSWAFVSAGDAHTCGIRNNELYCWGNNEFGQVGTTNLIERTPTRVGADADWVAVAAGGDHTCARKNDGRIFCFGHDRYGNLGRGTIPIETSPVQVGTQADWDAVATSHYVFGIAHTCGIRSGELWCFGANGSGQLGDGTTVNAQFPVRAGTDTDWASLGAGYEHSCAMKTDDSLYCWGSNWLGMLGDGTTTDRSVPTAIGGGWISVEGGRQHTCAVADDNTMWCWGRNSRSQLGNDTMTQSDVPVQVGSDADWDQASVGEFVSCGRRNGEIWCWGDAAGTVAPAAVDTASDWRTFAIGGNRICGIKTDDTLWCWNLGDTPSQVGVDADWDRLSAHSEDHACAIKNDQTLWCWGNNDYGQIGDGSMVDVGVPTQIGTDTWLSVAVAGWIWSGHTCGVKTDGTLWCWGDNGLGQLGVGGAWTSTPQLVGP